MKKIITLLLLLNLNNIIAQSELNSNIIYSDTPGRIFDTLYDQSNNKFPINNLRIIGSGASISSAPSLSCNAGYFTLWFVNSTTNPTLMNVMCQLFTDISCLITSPLSSACHTTTNTSTRVNIKVNVATFTNSALGNAAGYFAFPLNPTSQTPGIIDNMIYKTITSGVDAYIGIGPPLTQMNTFYHGEINISASASWNYNTTTTVVPTSNNDFYSVFLHEATHALGFASLFDSNGISEFGANNNYYARYDRFLCDNNNTPLLSSPILCSNTSMSFTGSILNTINTGNCIWPNTTISTNCSSVVKYISPNSYIVPVYTPPCWVKGSSLSHFEDACYPSNGAYGANNYFVMSRQNFPGTLKRYLQEEERKVLCDIGYSVNANYVSPVAGTSKSYSLGACSGNGVWGQNDGLLGGTYAYIMSTTSIVIPKASLLINDSPNSTSVTCVSMVYNDPQLILTTTNNNITISRAAGLSTVCGVFLIQYVPRDASNNQGNITYCYFYVPCIGQCSPPDLCHLVQNGGFESGSAGCGQGAVNSGLTSCWDDFTYHGGLAGADVYSRNCSALGFSVGSTFLSTNYGISNTYNGSPNDRIVRLVGAGSINPLTPSYSEVIKNKMSGVMTNSANYVLDFWAFNRTIFGTSTSTTQFVVSFATSNLAISPNNSFPIGLNTVVSCTLLAVDAGQWKHYVIPFTYTCSPGSNENYLYVGMDIVESLNLNNNQNFSEEFFIDDISINLAGVVSFTPPNQVCQGNTINNLAQYTNGNGNFYGPGVINNAGVWNINTTGLSPGMYNYNFVYTNTLTNCTYTTGAQINVLPTPSISITGSSGFNCLSNASNQATLNANSNLSSTSYTWFPVNSVTTSIVINPITNATYTLIGMSNGCTNIAITNINVGIQPTITLQKPLVFCTGDQYACLEILLTGNTPTVGSWTAPGLSLSVSGGTFQCSSLTVPFGTTPGTYSVTYNYTTGACNYSTSFNVPVYQTPTLNINQPGVYCLNIPSVSVQLTAQNSPSLPATNYTWFPGGANGNSIAVSPSVATVYTVVANNGTCASIPASVQVAISNSCCTANNYFQTPILTSGTYSGGYAINQNLIITGTVNIQGDFRIAPGVSITVMSGAILQTSVNNGAHLSACTAMWSGINIFGQGKVKFGPGDLIEDAFTAISSYNSNNVVGGKDIDVFRTTFNRNLVAIGIKNYTASLNFNPIRIANCLFTCRDFSLSPGQTAWPCSNGTGTNALPSYSSGNLPYSSPFYFNNFTVCNLKSPNTATFSYAGVSIENSGTTSNLNQANATYFSIDVGEVPLSNFVNYGVNIFDNLYYGIVAKNSNVNSINNIFQNTRPNGIGTGQYFAGAGINAFCDYFNTGNYNKQLSIVAPTTPTLYCNTFYNCHTAILTQFMLDLNIQYAKFHSSQNKTIIPASPSVYKGYGGVYFNTNRLKNYSINNNEFHNISNCINGGVSAGSTNLCPGGYGIAFGTLDIYNNLFDKNDGGPFFNSSTSFVSEAIRLNAIMAPKSSITTLLPNNGVRVQSNSILNVWRGVFIGDFRNTAFKKTVGSNYVLLEQDMNITNQQWAINFSSNNWTSADGNSIVGFGTSTSNTATGVYYSQNSSNSVQQNTVTTITRGFDFAGTNLNMIWACNSMSNSARGLQLSNVGVIGNQGNTYGPKDNKWLGVWTGKLHTYVDAASTATTSKLYVRNLTGYRPTINFPIGAASGYDLNTPTVSPGSQYFCGSSNFVITPTNCADCDEDFILKIASDTLVVTEDQEINRFMLYMNLDMDSVLTANNDTLGNFYLANMPESVGKIYGIEKLLGAGLFNDAISAINNFEPSSNFENNYKSFYQLYYTYKTNNDMLTNEDDLNTLAVLAAQCPFNDGPVVYKARNLYDKIIGYTILYNDDECYTTGYSERTSLNAESSNIQNQSFNNQLKLNESLNKKISNVLGYIIFPNPSFNEVRIKSKTENEQIELRITDILGREVYSNKILIISFNAKVKFDLYPGVYFVCIFNNKGKTTVQKLIVKD